MEFDATRIPEYLQWATQVIGVLSIVAAVTPTPIDNAVLVFLKKVIDFGGANFLSAENKKKPGEK